MEIVIERRLKIQIIILFISRIFKFLLFVSMYQLESSIS